MTCIVAVKAEDRIFVGADSAITHNDTINIESNRKVFTRKRFLMATAGSCRLRNLMAYSLTLPHHAPDVDVYVFMVTTFADALRSCMRDAGSLGKDNELDDIPGAAIIAYQGHLFEFHGDFSLTEYDEPYAAIGSGQHIALGSLYSTEQYDIPARDRVRIALQAAAKFIGGVAPPFEILEQKIPEKT